MRELDEEDVRIMIKIVLKSYSPVSLHVKLLNVVATENLRTSLGRPREDLDDQVDSRSSGSRDDLPKTSVVVNAKILI